MTRALEARDGYVFRMTERVAEILELAKSLTREERIELIATLRAEPLDEELGREAVRRLRELERGDVKAIPAEEFFDRLEARARARSA